MSAGQMVEDVELAVRGACDVALLGTLGGVVPTAAGITEKLLSCFG